MLVKIVLLILYTLVDSKVVRLHNLDFKTNGVPHKLKIDDTSSDKAREIISSHKAQNRIVNSAELNVETRDDTSTRKEKPKLKIDEKTPDPSRNKTHEIISSDKGKNRIFSSAELTVETREDSRKENYLQYIDKNLNDIENTLQSEVTELRSSPETSSLIKIKAMLKDIKEMLKREKKEKQVENDNFKSYVPISEDVENPEPQGLQRTAVLDGLHLINRGRRKIHDIV